MPTPITPDRLSAVAHRPDCRGWPGEGPCTCGRSLTPERLAELKSMPHDRNSSYAVINRTDFDALIAAAEERNELAKRVAELEANYETRVRKTLGAP